MCNKPRVLYIDDERDLLNLAASFFEDEGLPIEICTGFHEAIEKIRNGNYDLVISDARMPKGSGKELLNIIRKEINYSGKFILVTGNLDIQDDEDKHVFDLIMFKPVKFQELIDQVKEMLLLNLK